MVLLTLAEYICIKKQFVVMMCMCVSVFFDCGKTGDGEEGGIKGKKNK